MKKLIDKLEKHAVKIVLGTAIVGWLAIGNAIKSYEEGCGVFQGHNIKSDDERIEYVFDPKNETERGFTAPKYRIYGDPSLTDSLKIGELYYFTTKKGSLPWSKKYIIPSSIIPRNPKNSKNELR